MSITLDLQVAYQTEGIPTEQDFQQWVNSVLLPYKQSFELTIRIVSNDECQQLNKTYRQKDKPTNVLSFPFEVPEGMTLDLLGDIVIAADVVQQEAKEQNKALHAHWAHMVIHGTLHLLGFDHISDDDADEMEGIEIKLLTELGLKNPYDEIK